MNILEKKQSLFSLWLYSFSVVNKAIGKLMGVVLVSVLLMGLVFLVLTLTAGTAGFLARLQLMFLSKAAGIGVVLISLLASLASNLYGLFFITVCWRIMAAQAEEGALPLSEALTSSIRPTFYQFITGLLLAIPLLFLLTLVGLLHNKALLFIVMLGLFITIGVRLCYSFISIAIAQKGPIDGIVFSWKLTQGEGFKDALGMCLIAVGTAFLINLFFMAIIYSGFIIIPLYFAESFQLAHLSAWWGLGAFVLLIIGLFFYFIVLAFPVIVFTNRHAMFLQDDLSQQKAAGIDLPELAVSTQSTPHPAPDQPVQPAQSAPETDSSDVSELTDLEEVQVSQASINTSEEETTTLSKHLNQVYTPKPDEILEYVDEDRMPTLLFDEEMARQLQENQSLLAAQKKAKENTENKDEESGPIKMSKF